MIVGFKDVRINWNVLYFGFFGVMWIDDKFWYRGIVKMCWLELIWFWYLCFDFVFGVNGKDFFLIFCFFSEYVEF